MIVHPGRKTSEIQSETDFPDIDQYTIMSSLKGKRNQ